MCGQLPRRFFSALDTILPFFLAGPRPALYHQSPEFPNPNESQPDLNVPPLAVEARWRCRQIFGVEAAPREDHQSTRRFEQGSYSLPSKVKITVADATARCLLSNRNARDGKALSLRKSVSYLFRDT